MKRVFISLLAVIGMILAAPLGSEAGGDVQITAAAGVSVWLDDDFKGETPADGSGLYLGNIAAGSHVMRAARNGYMPLTIALAVEDDRTIEVALKLTAPAMDEEDLVTRINGVIEKEAGTFLLRSLPLRATIFFDGQELGLTDKKLNHVEPGEHAIRFVHNGKELQGTFMINANDILAIKADFVKGEISLQTDQVETGMGPVEIMLHTAKGKKPAFFKHRMHQDMFACAECHHGKNDKEQQTSYVEGMKIQKCVVCHNSTMANKQLSHFKLAAHARCKGCHKTAAEKGKAGPVIKCSGCHTDNSNDDSPEDATAPEAE